MESLSASGTEAVSQVPPLSPHPSVSSTTSSLSPWVLPSPYLSLSFLLFSHHRHLFLLPFVLLTPSPSLSPFSAPSHSPFSLPFSFSFSFLLSFGSYDYLSFLERFYEGVDPREVSGNIRTKYKWSFSGDSETPPTTTTTSTSQKGNSISEKPKKRSIDDLNKLLSDDEEEEEEERRRKRRKEEKERRREGPDYGPGPVPVCPFITPFPCHSFLSFLQIGYIYYNIRVYGFPLLGSSKLLIHRPIEFHWTCPAPSRRYSLTLSPIPFFSFFPFSLLFLSLFSAHFEVLVMGDDERRNIDRSHSKKEYKKFLKGEKEVLILHFFFFFLFLFFFLLLLLTPPPFPPPPPPDSSSSPP